MQFVTKTGALALCLALASSAAFAVDRLVPGTHATIQAAIDAAASSGDRVLITAAGTYVGTVPIPTKADVSINIISGKNVTIEASVNGVILTGPVKVENTSTVTLTNVTITNAAKGLVLNDTDTAFPAISLRRT